MDIRNNISFRARLDASNIVKDKARWENIGKIFEENTKNDRDTFILHQMSPQNMYISTLYNSVTAFFNKNVYKKLMKKPDREISKKLETISEISSEKTKAMQELVISSTKNHTQDIPYSMWENANKKLLQKANDAIQRDEILREANIDLNP